MMYIEHTPLEENLQDILRKSTLLAHVQEAVNGEHVAHSELHLEAQDRVAFASYRAVGGDSSRAEGHPQTAGINEGGGTSNGKTFGGIKFVNGAHDTCKIQQEEIVSDEEYELIDVIEFDENWEVAEDRKQKQQVNLTQGVTCTWDNKQDHSTNIIFEVDEEGDQFEYILTKISKKSQDAGCSKSRRVPNNNTDTSTLKYKKTLRPIPAAIPINKSSFSVSNPAEGDSVVPSIRILNGNTRILDNLNQTTSPLLNKYAAQSEILLEEDSPIRVTEGNEQYSQMGIITKLRQLLNFNSYSDHVADTEERTRKRRSEDKHLNVITPPQIKYRKIENRFPEVITHSVEGDDSELISPFPVNYNRKPNLLRKPDNFMRMAERRSSNSMESRKLRKSMFAAPEKTHKLIKNVSYADVEFSDDDELELVKGFGVDKDPDNVDTHATSVLRKPPIVYNIPVRHFRSEERHRYPSKPPPPLIDACTGNILMPHLVQQVDLVRKSNTQEKLRQHNQTSINNSRHGMGQPRASSSSSSGESIFASAGGFNIFNNKVNLNPWSTNAHSILAQEKESEEREKYRQLLEQMVPRLYGIENEHAHLPKSLTNSHDIAARQNEFFVGNTPNLSAIRNHRQPVPVRQGIRHLPLKRPPLSSTINLEDDEDDDVTITGIMQRKNSTTKNATMTVIIDDDVSEIVDLDEEEQKVVLACNKIKYGSTIDLDVIKDKTKQAERELPYVEPVNTLQDRFKSSPHLRENWLEKWQSDWNQKKKNRLREVHEATRIVEKLAVERRSAENEIQERLRKFQIVDPDLLVIDDFPEPIDAEPEFVTLTAEHQARIKAAVCGPTDQVLMTKFNLNITRRDIHTLLGHNWLNDEVINFYMNLLTERGDKKHESHGLPRVYAMNTFFVPRLMQAGHSGVKRWTRKVDIFSKDIIPVPVHVGGVHWCMAIIHIKNRSIRYYDSMGTPNPSVLRALEQYLKDESLDKRKQPYDTSQFEVESVQDVPRQMNGSDCGVFSCMFAEYITRNKEITFSQQNMEYFRHKMILEIVQGELLQ